jgi:hypothetical protein
MDLLGLASVGLLAAEWMALGWLSAVEWPAECSAFWAARWALRLLVGSALFSLSQLGLAFVGIGFSNVLLVLVLAAGAAGALRAIGPRTKTGTGIDMDTRERVAWLVLGAVLIAAAGRAAIVPESGWDAYSHWGLRAQAYALSGTIVNAHSEHEYYPPLVPLLEAGLYLQRGVASIDLGKTIWALVGSAFALCLAWHLRLSLPRTWLAPLFAAGIVLSTTALLEGFWTGQADLALTTFVTLATLAVFQWQRSADRAWLAQAAMFGAVAALTKFEGAPRIGVIVVALCIEARVVRSRETLRPALILFASASGMWLVWTAFVATHGLPTNSEHLGSFQPLALGSVLVSLAAVFGGVRTGGGVLVAALTWLVGARHLFSAPVRLLTLVVAGQVLATLFALLLSEIPPELQVRLAATRLVEQFLPVALFAGAVALASDKSTYNRPAR